jgi:hypothetical protein
LSVTVSGSSPVIIFSTMSDARLVSRNVRATYKWSTWNRVAGSLIDEASPDSSSDCHR